MYVGVIRLANRNRIAHVGIPHVCGGDPLLPANEMMQGVYSPCMWG